MQPHFQSGVVSKSVLSTFNLGVKNRALEADVIHHTKVSYSPGGLFRDFTDNKIFSIRGYLFVITDLSSLNGNIACHQCLSEKIMK